MKHSRERAKKFKERNSSNPDIVLPFAGKILPIEGEAGIVPDVDDLPTETPSSQVIPDTEMYAAPIKSNTEAKKQMKDIDGARKQLFFC